jgi:predicted MPP superfamily phosphohydrolase
MMIGQVLNIIVLIVILLLIDIYVIKGLRETPEKWNFFHKKRFPVIYISFSVLLFTILLLAICIKVGHMIRLAFILLFFISLLFKISFGLFLLLDDLRRLWLRTQNRAKAKTLTTPMISSHQDAIPRSEFLLKAGLLAGAVPLAALALDMKSGLYDYHVRRQKIYLTNLPKAFDGIKLGQISDIHSGSFFNKKAVLGGVEMLMREKADLIFFTGDLVNKYSHEMKDYQDIFSKVKAPLGVYSSLGNHDYGDYTYWPDTAAKIKNHAELINCHKNMGWDLLRNENRRLKINGEEIGILGVENWGDLGNEAKYGRMDLTVKNTDDLPVKLLLSHDPTHWRAQVLPQYPQIDMMFAGHTHGMQFGVRTSHFQWSPVEYVYKEWAGLYQEKQQQLYVNVGYGFLAIAGRVGILPEITIFELKSGTAPTTEKA